MAAVHPHSKLRSSSDPFSDPTPDSKPSALPPPVPSKSNHSSKMPAPLAKPVVLSRDPAAHDITEAVRDTVTVRGNTDSNPRNRVGRSQTAVNAPSPGRPSGRRSQSQDSVPANEKPKSSSKSRSKKGSQHADVIDRLDFTGVGPMFHHDGPFDACAPSRNRQRNKAPMFAWSGRPDELLSQRHNDGAYPTSNAHNAFQSSYVEPPKKKVDAIAEAWGIHEPEPFEEFFAGGGSSRAEGDTPASSIYNGRDSHNSHSTRSSGFPKRPKDGQRDVVDDSRPRAAVRRSVVPPPQPIFVPGPMDSIEPASGSPPTPGFPKRSKSLMHRIRKMRDAPNVPVGADMDEPASPSSPGDGSGRPTHRSQNSFLGRFGNRQNQSVSPSDRPEPYVYIDPQNNKDLPATPQLAQSAPTDSPAVTGYFENTPGAGGGGPTSPGIGRKASIMQKVGRVVRGAR